MTTESRVEKPQTWYVYTYSFPDDTVFYVGKGTGDRINAHEDEAARGCPCRKCETIRQIWSSGSPVKKRIVFETLVEKEALDYEMTCIRSHMSPCLTNIQIGVTLPHLPNIKRETVDLPYEELVKQNDPSSENPLSRFMDALEEYLDSLNFRTILDDLD